jgi:hypothetical protein
VLRRRTQNKGDRLGLLELKVRNDRWPEMPLFADIKKLKLDCWDFYFFQKAIRDITNVQRERFGFEYGLLLCSVGDTLVLDDLDARLSGSTWPCCKGTYTRLMSISRVVEGRRAFHPELEFATNDLLRTINASNNILGVPNFPLHGAGAMGGAVWSVKVLSV